MGKGIKKEIRTYREREDKCKRFRGTEAFLHQPKLAHQLK